MTNAKRLSNIVYGVLGLAVAFMMAFGMVFTAQSANADDTQSAAELQAQIASLLQTIQNLQAELSSLQGGSSVSGSVNYTFTADLHMGSTGVGVLKLQQALNADPDTRVAATGAGSPGMETSYYGALTANAVSRFQEKYASDILFPLGLTKGTGYFGASSRAKMNALLAANPSTPGTPGTPSSDNLKGGEANISDFSFDNGDDSDVTESGNGDVATIEYTPEDGDVALNRVDLDFDLSGFNENHPEDVFDTISLYDGNTKIGSIDGSDEDNWTKESTDVYSIRLGGLDYVTREDDDANLTVRVEVQNGAYDDGGDNTITMYIPTLGMRFMDPIGLPQYAGSASQTVDFDVVEKGNNDSLDISESNDNPDAATLQVDDTNTSDQYDVLAFDMEAGDHDITIDTIPVTVAISGTSSYAGVVSSAELDIDGKTFNINNNDIDNRLSTTSDAVLNFDTDGYQIDANDTATAVLKLKFRNQDDSRYADGTTLSASVTTGNADNIDAEGADDLESGDISGSANGETMTLSTTGTEVDITSVTSDSDSDSNSGTFTWKFTVSADGGDVQMHSSDVIAEVIGGTPVSTSTTLVSTDADGSVNTYTVKDGQTDHFTYTYTVNGSSSSNSTYYVQLDSVAGNSISGDDALSGPETF